MLNIKKFTPRYLAAEVRQQLEDLRTGIQSGSQLFLSAPLESVTHLSNLARWRVGWSKYDLDYRPKDLLCEKQMTVRQAVAQIDDGAVVFSCGFGAIGRCSLFFWGVRDRYLTEKHPHSLTWISVCGQGGRGKLPGSVEELAVPGLMHRYICGHMETARALLQQADEGWLELHSLPQGVMAQLIAAQAEGEQSLVSTVGSGTFLDPRCGGGSAITRVPSVQLIKAVDEGLEYHLPAFDVVLVTAPYADREGNVYFSSAPVIAENREAAAVAHANGGKVFVAVGEIIEPSENLSPDIPAEWVTGIVINPRQEQTTGVLQQDAWPEFMPEFDGDVEHAVDGLRLLNKLSGGAARRSQADLFVTRVAAEILLEQTAEGSLINIGTGMSEEVCYAALKLPGAEQRIFSAESGVYGGVPAPGIFFGAAIKPEKIESSAWIFDQYSQRLDATVLGFLQVDSAGNVNVAHRGEGASNFVGPGGFCDLVEYANTIIFVGSWMQQGRYRYEGEKMHITRYGEAKFVEQVNKITFNGQRALEQGKTVYYVSHVGVFRLTDAGLRLEEIFPGIDLQKDILDISRARIVLKK